MAHGVPALHPERRGSLDRSPKANWVEKRGGLPPYINSVATALVRGGMSRSHAIQVAINTVKKACATGLWGGQKRKVSGAIQAAACKAAAQWEAMKASASIDDDGRMALELAGLWDREGLLELAWHRAAHGVTRGVWSLPLTLAQCRSLDSDEMAPTLELAGGRAGLVSRKIQVRNNKGTTFWRTVLVRPGDAKAMDRQGVSTRGRKGKAATPGKKPAKGKASKGPFTEAAKRAPKRKVDPGKTSDHAKAGLHKIGKVGNVYTDSSGNPWHRVGTGKGSRFKPGLPPKSAKPKVSKGKPAKKKAPAKKAAPKKRSSSAADQGLTRVVGRGSHVDRNRYTNAKGDVSHRVGKGKASRFVKGEAPKKGRGPKKAKRAPKKVKPVHMAREGVQATSAADPAKTSGVELAGPSRSVRLVAQRKGQALPGGRFPIRNVADLRKAIRAFGRAKEQDKPKVKAFIKRRARALGATDLLPDNW